MEQQSSIQRYIRQCSEAVRRLGQGDYRVDLPEAPDEMLAVLGRALQGLARRLERQAHQWERLNQLTSRLNAGLLLDDILDEVYRDFRDVIPYNRIGLALLEQEGHILRTYWARSDQPVMKIDRGYAAPMAGSSLEKVLDTGQPRILNDLLDYLAKKPSSASTRLIVAEGIRSSLTCPLVANGNPVGFIFFSSVEKNTYASVHVDLYESISGQLSVIVEKGHLASELAAQKTAIEDQNAELRRLNELKNTFLGIAAHDLRSPIGYIQTATDLLLDKSAWSSKEEWQAYLNEFLQSLGDQTRHILALLEDLLDVSVIESGRLTLKLEVVEVGDFLREVVSRHVPIAAQKGTRVALDGAPAGAVSADPNRLTQVMDNLIANAIKFSPPGSAVQVSAQRDKSSWRVQVKDQGPGITEADRERLFQSFSRLSALPTAGEKSTGLGLAITRRVVEAHGGQIGVDSSPGQGSTFWFTLPV
jgi:signal transduction histidine kinase